MAVIYDEYYQKEKYFGKSHPELSLFFDGLSREYKVLDLGCGQGRDAIIIGRLGFAVVGVDISKVGIIQMNEIAKTEKLDVTGVVQDLNLYSAMKDFDVILLDSMLHFYKGDVINETKLLNKIIKDMKFKAQLVIFIQKNKSREKVLKNVLRKVPFKLVTIVDKYVKYSDQGWDYLMLVVQKDDEEKKNKRNNRGKTQISLSNKETKLTCISNLVNR